MTCKLKLEIALRAIFNELFMLDKVLIIDVWCWWCLAGLEKNIYFPAIWAKFSPKIADFPNVFLFFPQNHRISWKGASLLPGFFFFFFFSSGAWATIFGPLNATTYEQLQKFRVSFTIFSMTCSFPLNRLLATVWSDNIIIGLKLIIDDKLSSMIVWHLNKTIHTFFS